LFHGRTDPSEDLDNWGSKGPVFLVDYVHVTYRFDIKLGVPEPAGDGDLKFADDLVYYDGVYYGDWSVFPEALLNQEPELRLRLTTFDHKKARKA
jgi:hypothetical protein